MINRKNIQNFKRNTKRLKYIISEIVISLSILLTVPFWFLFEDYDDDKQFGVVTLFAMFELAIYIFFVIILFS